MAEAGTMGTATAAWRAPVRTASVALSYSVPQERKIASADRSAGRRDDEKYGSSCRDT
jgi:hypothetical protein